MIVAVCIGYPPLPIALGWEREFPRLVATHADSPLARGVADLPVVRDGVGWKLVDAPMARIDELRPSLSPLARLQIDRALTK